jgi:flagellar protein FlaG
MEVIDVYVDSYSSSMAISTQTTPKKSAASQGSAKSYTADTSNSASISSTDGAGQASTGTDIVDNRTDEEKAAADKEKIKEALEKMKAQLPNSEIKFGIHEKTDRVTIKLVDKDTQEVIKEFPPEKTLDMIAKCMEIAGVLVDEKM